MASGGDLEMGLPGGVSERLGFFGELFGVTHLPAGTPRGGVVICSPLYSEFLKNNRREVMLGRRLADIGWAVQRFHYRGTGNSGGDGLQLSLQTLTEDALAAQARLESVAGMKADVVVATRLGSFPAGALMHPDSRLVLWEPVSSGKRYFRELIRSVIILGMKRGMGRTAETLEAEFEATGSIDIAGFSVPRVLRDSALPARLEIPDGLGGAVVMQLGRSLETRPDIQATVDVIEAAGRKAAVVPLDFEEAWWFHRDVDVLDPSEGDALDDALVDHTLAWLCEGTT